MDSCTVEPFVLSKDFILTTTPYNIFILCKLVTLKGQMNTCFGITILQRNYATENAFNHMCSTWKFISSHGHQAWMVQPINL